MTPKPYRHLPPGRAPGGQTRRGGSVEARNPVQLALATAPIVFVVAVIVLSPLEGPVRWAVGIGGALVLGLLARMLRQRSAAISAATHLQLRPSTDEPRRGEELVVSLTVVDPSKLKGDRLEVGLECIERYDYRQQQSNSGSSVGSAGSSSRRVTRRATVFERWLPAQRSVASETFTFHIPPDAPFSHEGDCLSFSWMLTAREHVAHGIDTRLDHPLWVRP